MVSGLTKEVSELGDAHFPPFWARSSRFAFCRSRNRRTHIIMRSAISSTSSNTAIMLRPSHRPTWPPKSAINENAWQKNGTMYYKSAVAINMFYWLQIQELVWQSWNCYESRIVGLVANTLNSGGKRRFLSRWQAADILTNMRIFKCDAGNSLPGKLFHSRWIHS